MFSAYFWTAPSQVETPWYARPLSRQTTQRCRTHGNSTPRRPGLVIQLENVCDDSRDPSLLRSIYPNRSAVGAPAVPLPCRTVVQRPKGPQLLGGQVAIGSGAPARHPRAGGPPPVRSGDLPGTGRGPGPPSGGGGPDPPSRGVPGGPNGGPPPGGSGRGGRSPTVTPPGVTPPSGGVKNAVFGRHLVLYNLVGFFPVLISGCGRIFGRGKRPPGGGTPPTPPGGVKNRDFWTPPRNASPGPPRGGSGPSSIDPPLPPPPGLGAGRFLDLSD